MKTFSWLLKYQTNYCLFPIIWVSRESVPQLRARKFNIGVSASEALSHKFATQIHTRCNNLTWLFAIELKTCKTFTKKRQAKKETTANKYFHIVRLYGPFTYALKKRYSGEYSYESNIRIYTNSVDCKLNTAIPHCFETIWVM